MIQNVSDTAFMVAVYRAEEVASLADDLRSQATFQYWIVDYFSPMTYKYRERAAKQSMKNAPFRFQPKDYYGFLLKWLVRLTGVFAPREKRDAFRKFAAYVLFEPAQH